MLIWALNNIITVFLELVISYSNYMSIDAFTTGPHTFQHVLYKVDWPKVRYRNIMKLINNWKRYSGEYNSKPWLFQIGYYIIK